ncbi:hypothetical protein GCM10012290_06990 [Halolactibacillus alkaliphilus]|uniref:histidine kinase n=1 Tax=Halolactibacillus alkaliphilus TaxID=442899 RepID=A0A511WZM5_9BACI|nr:PAS domain-containing sensor histidine kinase [Halolactibacillus alkaliphilus]GEN56147.1 hypothetical protein HAL01_06110 [Halolactibacillus alkaliphilus]GGN66889.1 hypothetical protein GCM10012290_06990 [Halolactibacillus alkaliphilus]SFO71927.1 PAS domain S-box-containing protein [Halolactibacillus alkaliphilus]
MTTRFNTYHRLINKPLVVSIIFGLIGLLGSMYSLRIPFGDFHLNMIWSIAFPLMVTLTYGLTFGLLSVTIGLTFLYPFLLGFMNGYGSFVAMIALYAWIFFHGYGKKRRELKPTLLNHPYVIQLSYSVLRLLLYALLFQPLVQLNPPPWNPEAYQTISSNIVWYFSIRGVFMEMILLLIVDTLLLLPLVRKFFGLKTAPSSRYNTRVLGGFLGGGLLFILIILAMQHTLIDEVPLQTWLLPPNPKTALTLFLSSFLFIIMAGVTMRYVEKTLTSEDALKETYKRYQAIFEQMHDIYLELKTDGTILHASPSIQSALDMNEQALIGTNFCQLFLDHGTGKAWMEELDQRGGFIEKKIMIQTKAKETRVWSIHLKKVQLVEHMPRLIAMIRDVTDYEEAMDEIKRLNNDLEQRVERRTADLNATVEALERFNYVVSHDLKTPIRAIDAYAEMIYEDEQDTLSKISLKSLTAIRHVSTEMIHLIERLLNYARISHMRPKKESVDLNQLVNTTLEQLAASNKHHPFTATIVQPLPVLDSDPVLIKQVIMNLFDNAIKYQKETEPLHIEIDQHDTKDALTLIISDNGRGINQHQQEHVWELFSTSHQDTKGTGIGLSTVKRIMEAHGGSVSLFSKQNEGTTIQLSFKKSAN